MKLPAELGLPFDDWRAGQRIAIRTALHGKKLHTVIQAPTGKGKSLIAASLSKLDPNSRTPILTATNALLKQYHNIYSHLSPIRGASNYQCLAAGDELKRFFRLIARKSSVACDDGPCRSGIKCSLKESGCTYYDAVRAASNSNAPLTNYAYWLAMRRYAGGLGRADRLVVDEAHTLPEELMKAFRIDIYRHELRGMKWPRTIAGWKSWGAMKADMTSAVTTGDEDYRVKRQKAIERFRQLSAIDEHWAYDVGPESVTFEPTVPRLLFPLLADATTRVVYLSATITPTMLTMLGIDPDQVEFFTLPSTFPLASRPIYILRTTRVDNKMSGEQRDWWLNKHDKIIGQRLDRKGIIHCSSYERQQLIVSSSKYRSMMLAPSAKQLIAAVETFKTMAPPAILVSPSVEAGFDFPYDECEYQIISKTPFPDTRSAIMRARIAATDRYRDHLTMQRVVQAAGRGMRADDDQCETFILDDHFSWFVNAHADLAPGWFIDALIWTKKLPPVSAKLANRILKRAADRARSAQVQMRLFGS